MTLETVLKLSISIPGVGSKVLWQKSTWGVKSYVTSLLNYNLLNVIKNKIKKNIHNKIGHNEIIMSIFKFMIQIIKRSS